MKHRHKLTIALQTYNRYDSGYLEQALEAVLSQTYSDFELLVVDNHSTDRTPDFLKTCGDPRLTYIRHPPGGNATTSYFRSIMMSGGEYIILTHDDDIMEPTMIQRQMEYLDEHPDLLCLATNVSLIDEQGTAIQSRLYELEKNFLFHEAEYIKYYFEEKLWLPAPTLLFKRDPYLKTATRWLGHKDHQYLASGDIWITCVLNLMGPIGILAEPLLKYRQHSGQESRNVNQSSPLIEVVHLLLKHHGRHPKLRPLLPSIEAYYARFKTQDILFECSTRDQVIKKINTVKKRWEKEVSPNQRAIDTILPFEILLDLLGLDATVPDDKFKQLESTPARGGARIGFRAWLSALKNGKAIFDQIGQFKKIALLGSMLNAYILVESARQSGIEVFFCFDSSPARTGKKVFDVPVVPLKELPDHVENIDAILLSSEHDQEDALKVIIKEHLPQNISIPIISWKELADQASRNCSTRV